MADEPVEVVEPVAEPAPVAAEPPAPEPAPEPAPAPAPAPQMVPLRVMQERIGEESNKRQAAEERERAATERNREFEAIVNRLQAKSADPAAPAPRAEPAAPARPTATTGIDPSAVAQARTQLMLEKVISDGNATYGAKWQPAVAALDSYGADTVEFVMGVVEVDAARAHDIMFQLSQDPEKAVQLAKMSPTARTAAITRMSDAMAQAAAAEPKPVTPDPAPKPAISRAPAPKPAIAPIAPAPEVNWETPEGNEKISDREFEDRYKAKYYKRSA